jgi:hypothetical protein
LDFLRKVWGEVLNGIYLWALGLLLFTAIMGGIGGLGVFSATSNIDSRVGEQSVRKEPPSPRKGW